MGLDVYLYRSEDREKSKADSKAFNDEVEALGLWGDNWTKEARDAKLAELAEKHGTDNWGESKLVTKVEEPSKVVPGEQLFRVGYFRSSYNGAGLNRVMKKLGLPDLHDIFNTDGNEYEFTPDWAASLERAKQAVAGYGEHLTSTAGKFVVHELRNPMARVADEKEALDVFLKELEKHKPDPNGWFGAYSNQYGDFFMDRPLKVRAVLHEKKGQQHPMLAALGAEESVFVVVEKDDPQPTDSYLDALRIVQETIEYVLAQPDPQKFYLHWSG